MNLKSPCLEMGMQQAREAPTDGYRSGQHEAEECSNFRKDGLGLGNAGCKVSEDG